MQPIKAAIKPGESGPQVTSLQDALFLLLERKIIGSSDPAGPPTVEELEKLTAGLKEERAHSFFGESTTALVRYFQIQQGLGNNLDGIVEAQTAAKLNEILKMLGVLDPVAAFAVRGTIRLPASRPERMTPSI